MSIQEKLSGIWDLVKATPAVTRTRLSIPPERVTASDSGQPLVADGGYFTVTVNEMFLRHEREWFSSYDPLVSVVTEFIYDGAIKVVPVVVGPALLKGFKAEETPIGMTYANTRVAGLHPFRGGRLVLTVVLSRVQRTDRARDLLELVQLGAKAFDYASALSGYLSVAEVLTGGIESILGLDGTRPVLGHRQEYDADAAGRLLPGYRVLIDLPEADVDPVRLWVKEDRLHEGDSAEKAKPFTRGDFVLYSLRSVPRRSDLDLLPLAPLLKRVKREAQTSLAGAWDSAKVSLATLIQDTRESPDLTAAQCEDLISQWKAEAKRLHQDAVDLATLSRGEGARSDGAQARARQEALEVLRM